MVDHNAGHPLAHPVPAALARAYRAKGWHVTDAGAVGIGQHVGPCTGGCGRPVLRYGDRARPMCDACRLARGVAESRPDIVAELAAIMNIDKGAGNGEIRRAA